MGSENAAPRAPFAAESEHGSVGEGPAEGESRRPHGRRLQNPPVRRPAGASASWVLAVRIWQLPKNLLMFSTPTAVALVDATLNFGYATRLRRSAMVDIAVIAAACVIWAAGGGVATVIPISRWVVLVVSLAGLFAAAGRRYGDILDPASRRSQSVLAQYNAVSCAW